MWRVFVHEKFSGTSQRGQAVLEYILLTVMLAVTFAVIIRNTNLQIYRVWTGLTSSIASPCAQCKVGAPPDL